MANQGVTPEAGRDGWLLEIRYRWPKDRLIETPEGSDGFLLTFPTREAAEEWRKHSPYPTATITSFDRDAAAQPKGADHG